MQTSRTTEKQGHAPYFDENLYKLNLRNHEKKEKGLEKKGKSSHKSLRSLYLLRSCNKLTLPAFYLVCSMQLVPKKNLLQVNAYTTIEAQICFLVCIFLVAYYILRSSCTKCILVNLF